MNHNAKNRFDRDPLDRKRLVDKKRAAQHARQREVQEDVRSWLNYLSTPQRVAR